MVGRVSDLTGEVGVSVQDTGGSRRRAGGRGRRDLSAPLLPGRGPLASMPPIAVFLVVIAMIAVAVIVGGVVGAVLLGLLALGVVALLAATWSRLRPTDRAGRIVVLVVLVLVAVGMLTHGGLVR